MFSSVSRSFDFTAFPFVFALLAAYVLTGMVCWHHLLTHARTVGDAEMIALSRLSIWGKLGKALLVLFWPLWTILPFIVLRLTRPRVEDDTVAMVAQTEA